MNGNNSPVARYGAVAQALHWITAILVLIAFIYGPGGSEQRVYSAAKDADRQLHETLGLCVLVLTTVRLAWRLVEGRPDPPAVARWLGRLATFVRWLLYVMLFAVPLTAISGAWLEGHPLTLLGGVEIAGPMTAQHDTGARIATLHPWLGDTILWVAGFHALAAIVHHFILKDSVLVTMLPGWMLRSPTTTRPK
jgi:cytochrome b561